MGGSNKPKVNIPMCAAFILFVLTLISIHLTSGLFARYTVTATGSDSARVAKFDVTGDFHVAGDDNKTEVMVDCKETGKSGVYNITVTNNSEVVVGYIIYIKPNQAVNGTDMRVLMDGNVGAVSQNMMFTRGPLAPGDTEIHTFEFGIYDWGTVTGKVQGQESYNWELGFTVEIVVSQVD